MREERRDKPKVDEVMVVIERKMEVSGGRGAERETAKLRRKIKSTRQYKEM